MQIINDAAYVIAAASRGNPVLAILSVMLFYLLFDLVEASIEKLIWGDAFSHWLDPIFAVFFMAFSGLTVWKCAVYNAKELL